MRVQDVMSTHLVKVSPDDSVRAALERLRASRIHHLIVVDRKKLAGIVSDRDLLGSDGDAALRDVMTRGVITIEPGATLRKAAALMAGHAIHSLLVVNRDVEGIVTASDLLRALAKGATHPAPPPERYVLRKRGPRKRARVV